MTVLACLASIPTREHFLPQVLASLRPQVDRLHVYLNGYASVPACVLDLADNWVLSADNMGAERKLQWAPEHTGIYLSCDDDLVYPSDYAKRMVAAVVEWGGEAICSAHGRTYEGRPRDVHDVSPGSIGTFLMTVPAGRLINHAGTGVMAWDASKVRVPAQWPMANIADMQMAIWAQQQRVPMYLVPHETGWIKNCLPQQPGLFRQSQREQHHRRNTLLRTHEWYRWEE